nr:hypothetical protein Iba_chr04bCG7510 [Ipomoea batatas]
MKKNPICCLLLLRLYVIRQQADAHGPQLQGNTANLQGMFHWDPLPAPAPPCSFPPPPSYSPGRPYSLTISKTRPTTPGPHSPPPIQTPAAHPPEERGKEPPAASWTTSASAPEWTPLTSSSSDETRFPSSRFAGRREIELLPSFNFKDVNLGLYLSGYPFNAKWERTTSYVFSSSSSSLTSALKLGT